MSDDNEYDEVTARRQADAEAERDEQHDRTLVLEEREACAALVEAAGCICEDLNLARIFTGKMANTWTSLFLVEIHDPRCSVALAAKIRGRA